MLIRRYVPTLNGVTDHRPGRRCSTQVVWAHPAWRIPTPVRVELATKPCNARCSRPNTITIPICSHARNTSGTYAPRSGSLWLSDVSHHHLALGIVALLLSHMLSVASLPRWPLGCLQNASGTSSRRRPNTRQPYASSSWIRSGQSRLSMDVLLTSEGLHFLGAVAYGLADERRSYLYCVR